MPCWACFLLMAAHDPEAHRSLIAFAGWANIAHAGVMALQEYRHAIERRELAGVVIFGIIGIALVVLTPEKRLAGRASAARV
jgi:hypothetical protein